MSKGVIDFHTHAFPDELAARAMKALLEEAPGVKAYLDGTVSALMGSMDTAGIEKSVLCCIATKPKQFEQILNWCEQIRSERIIPFPSVHPDDPQRMEHIEQVRKEGFKGIKLHPFYQDFYADQEKMTAYYEKTCREGLMLVMHTGYDIAFPRIRRADTKRILSIKKKFPELRLVTTHLGAWEQWDEVEEHLIGCNIYMELSFAFGYLDAARIRQMIVSHPEGYILFGSDSPWTSQIETLSLLRDLELPEQLEKQILSDNANRLLNLQ